MIFKRKEQFEFFTNFKMVEKIYPIESVKNLKMDWIKDARKGFTNTGNEKASHLCSGIRAIASHGWIVKSWCDFQLVTNGDGVSFKAAFPNERIASRDYPDPVGYFSAEQAGNLIPLLDGTMKSMVKIHSTWMFNAPDGWGLMFVPLQYHGETRFYSSIGILDPRISNEVNPVLFWHSKNSNEVIKAGTPLCQIIPIQLNHLDAIVRGATEEEMRWKDLEQEIRWTTFRPNIKTMMGFYEKFFKGKK